MKNLKSNLIAGITVIALLFGVFVAVKAMQDETKNKEIKKTVSETWYFNGSVDNDPTNPQNYSRTPQNPGQCTSPFETICEITAPANGDEPDMSEVVGAKTIEQHINDALSQLPAATPPSNPVVSAYKPL
ncbi:hypothetical protein [Sphingobacterium bovistauri]|uniref:Uncharacterized protein n=1 Tax=Sphingobacterium bovistauri TaxID=2781959 RepID=A0ABS7Z694_9SPHI|nr:hypothetical protein [Sphingobacterium bovistauri]MCA5005675.1 hypothetical protein [Sphingobacterium bovistauri]